MQLKYMLQTTKIYQKYLIWTKTQKSVIKWANDGWCVNRKWNIHCINNQLDVGDDEKHLHMCRKMN